MSNQITYPKAHSKSELQKVYKKASIEIKREVKILAKEQKSNIKTNLTESNALAKVMKVDMGLVKSEFLPKMKEKALGLKKVKLTKERPIEGHNPARFAPFDVAFRSNVSSDAGAWANNHFLSRVNGQSISNIGAVGAGTARAITNIGEWFITPSEGAIYIAAQARINGVAAASSTFGYSDVYVQLHLFAVSRRGPTFHFVNNIWSSGGVFNIGIKSFSNEVQTVSGVIPVPRNIPYLILGTPHLSVGAGGAASAAANLSMTIGPISMFAV